MLRQSIERQLISDVPLGTFLSGGVDSTAVTHFALEKLKKLDAFTIDTNESQNADLNFAKSFVDSKNINLNIVKTTPSITDDLDQILYFLDEPQADPAIASTFYISKLAAEKGIKVLLSGTGGDDILSGYRRHQALKLSRFLPNKLEKFAQKITSFFPLQHNFLRRVSKALEYSHLRGDKG